MVTGKEILKMVGVAGLALLIGQGCSQKSLRASGDGETFEQGAQYADNQNGQNNPWAQGHQPQGWQGRTSPGQSQWSQNQDGEWQYGAGASGQEQARGIEPQTPAQAYINGVPQGQSGSGSQASTQQGGLSYFGGEQNQSWTNGPLAGLQDYGGSGQYPYGQNGRMAEEFVQEEYNNLGDPSQSYANGQGGHYGQSGYGDSHSRVQIDLQDVFFEFDSWRISQDGMQALSHDADWLDQNHSRTLTVEGHCDQRGTRDYNLVLGKKRAEAVRTYLVDLGVEAHKIQVISYGKERPFCFGNDEQCYQLNRRGHLQLHH